MKARTTDTIPVAGMALICIIIAFGAQVAIANSSNLKEGWIATGTVTKVEGDVFYFLGKDNNVYKIDAGKAVFLADGLNTDISTVKTGDVVRVYGNVIGSRNIKAMRVRILEHEEQPADTTAAPEKKIVVIIEKPPSEPAQVGAGENLPQEPVRQQEGSWNAQGLVLDVDYTGRRVKLQTVGGTYTINVARAVFSSGGRRVALAVLNPGDVIRISGNLVGFNEVDALQLRVLRTRIDADSAVPQTPVSVAGVIQSIDYASLTFKMKTGANEILIATDDTTVIQQHQLVMSFMNLRPGMRVKMSGYGAPGTGYAAQHILIISVSP